MARKVFPRSQLRQHSCPQRFLDLDCSCWRDLRDYLFNLLHLQMGRVRPRESYTPRYTGQSPGWDPSPVSTDLAVLAAPATQAWRASWRKEVTAQERALERPGLLVGCLERAQVGRTSAY